jgi:sugar lactone lactonase YvrE
MRPSASGSLLGILLLSLLALATAASSAPFPPRWPASAASAPGTASAEEPTVVAWFDPAAGELPAGIAVDPQGNRYVAMALTGEIWRIAPDGTVRPFARLPHPAPGRIAGLAESFGSLLAVVVTSDPARHGIWMIPADGRAIARFAALDQDGTPHGIAPHGMGPAVFVSDRARGQIWIIGVEPDATGRLAPRPATWTASPLLLGDPAALGGVSRGASGIALFDGALYVANSDYGRIVRIPIRLDTLMLEGPALGLPPGPVPMPIPSAGEPEVYVEDRTRLQGADGIAFDSRGNLYVAVEPAGRLVRISPQRELSVLWEGVPLQAPSGLAFGTGEDWETLYVTDSRLADPRGPAEARMAGVVGLAVGVPGLLPGGGPPPIAMPPLPAGVSDLDVARCLAERGDLATCAAELGSPPPLEPGAHPPGAPPTADPTQNAIAIQAITPQEGTTLERGAEVRVEATIAYTLHTAGPAQINLIVQDQDLQPLTLGLPASVAVEPGTGSARIATTVIVPNTGVSALSVFVALHPVDAATTNTVAVVSYLVH